MNILVTGAAGFVGHHLMHHLATAKPTTLVGTVLGESDPQASLAGLDLLDYPAVKQLLAKVKPDIIYHLAAFSSPALSFKQPVAAITSSLTMQINLYEACLELELRPTFVIISSAQIYGISKDHAHLPLTEASPVGFTSPYAVAKVGQENLAHLYAHRGFRSIIARPFNHIGPGQQLGFLVSDLAQQIVALEKAPQPGPLMVGDLSSRRDFTDVRDIVQAYALLAGMGEPGEIYNVCSGRTASGQEILDMLLAHSSADITVERDPSRLRPSDIPELYGDRTKLTQQTGWEPRIPLEQTLSDVLADWRSQA